MYLNGDPHQVLRNDRLRRSDRSFGPVVSGGDLCTDFDKKSLQRIKMKLLNLNNKFEHFWIVIDAFDEFIVVMEELV
jgi:hypothetical protein